MRIKKQIQQSFDRAAHSYDAASDLQRQACRLLATELNSLSTRSPLILDAGCGTGYATELLSSRFPTSTIIGLDIAPNMLKRLPTNAIPVAADLEQLPIANEIFNLYWSSLSLQWCDLSLALQEAQRVLASNGMMAIATLGNQTFGELRQAFSGIDGYNHTWPFQSHQTIVLATESADFGSVQSQSKTVVMHYPNLKTLLREIKSVGANQVGNNRRKGLMTPKQFANAEAAYESLRTPLGLPLTYEIIMVSAQKATKDTS